MWKSIGRKKDFIRKFLCFSASPLSPHTLKWKVLALFSFSCQKKAVCVCVWARESHKDRKHPVVCCEITGIDVRNKKKRKKYNKKKKITELHRCTAFVAVSRWPWRRSSQKQIKHNLNAVQWRQLPTLQSDPSAENSFISQKAFKTLELSSRGVCSAAEDLHIHKKVLRMKRVADMTTTSWWRGLRGSCIWGSSLPLPSGFMSSGLSVGRSSTWRRLRQKVTFGFRCSETFYHVHWF